jgi:prepilin-type N-terminal cleavage/methylation domain-containing protein/prepilin-type processing-associated H-X9-DG protein
MKSKNAFTLIELLVVIAILAILIAILMPASLKGIEMANRSKCTNNLKAIGSACIAYAADNKGWLPYGNAAEPTTPFAEQEKNLRKQVGKLYNGGYVTDLRTWVCPSDKVDYSGKAVTVAASSSITSNNNTFNSIGNCSYMYISGYSLVRTMASPAVAPVLCDEANAREFGPANAGNMPDLLADDNHGANIRNVLFLDGHVVTLKDANAANAIFDNLITPVDVTPSLCSVD